ncbi:MAG: prepilin-type N-terminal cleavage/methylation domain-containing protein [Pirellulales bacterium]
MTRLAAPNRRRGVSLLEMLAVISLMGVCFVTLTTVLSACLRADRQLVSQANTGRSLQRLALQWRQDVHAARVVRLPATLELADGSVVEYRFEREKVERRVTRGERPVHRDSFMIPPQVLASTEATDDAPRRAVLLLRPDEATVRPAFGWRVERRMEAVLPPHAQLVRPRRRRRRPSHRRDVDGLIPPVTSRRRGVILIAALVCFLVVTLLVAVAAQRILVQYREARTRERQWQAEWLAESARQRAVAQLRSEPTYQGETWTIAADELLKASDPTGAHITIEVTKVPDAPSKRQIRIAARYPADPLRGVQRNIETQITLPETGAAP